MSEPMKESFPVIVMQAHRRLFEYHLEKNDSEEASEDVRRAGQIMDVLSERYSAMSLLVARKIWEQK